MDAEKILTILVDIYCQQNNLTIEELEMKNKEPEKEVDGQIWADNI